jgi:hypothetical protein
MLEVKKIIEMYPNFIDIREHCIMRVHNGIVVENYSETRPDFDDIIKFIEGLNLQKVSYGSGVLHILKDDKSMITERR